MKPVKPSDGQLAYRCRHAGILLDGPAASKERDEEYYSADDYQQVGYVKVFVVQEGVEFMVVGFGADAD